MRFEEELWLFITFAFGSFCKHVKFEITIQYSYTSFLAISNILEFKKLMYDYKFWGWQRCAIIQNIFITPFCSYYIQMYINDVVTILLELIPSMYKRNAFYHSNFKNRRMLAKHAFYNFWTINWYRKLEIYISDMIIYNCLFLVYWLLRKKQTLIPRKQRYSLRQR